MAIAEIDVMDVPAALLQKKKRAGGDELDVVRMSKDGEGGWHGARLFHLTEFYQSSAFFRALIRREDDFEALQRLTQTGEWHVFVFIQRIEEGLELIGVGMITHITGVEHLHRELAPALFVGVQLVGVKFIIEQTAVTADEMGVEVVGLEAVHHRRALAHLATFEMQKRDAGGVVFVRGKNVTPALGRDTAHRLYLGAHEHQQRVQRVAACRQQR